MRIRLLGTGSADGWPNPWCGCASCTAASAAGIVRGQTSALIDDRLLLEVGPDGPRAALRQGVDLRDVEVVLVTHAHPDHHAWPAWLWRSWAAGRGPLTLVAPPAVQTAARPHLDPTVTPIAVSPGDRLTVAGYDIVVVPATHAGPDAGPAVLYDVTGPDGATMLWATDTGVLSDAALTLVTGREYDLVLLDLTSAHLPDHHDLRTWPEQVAELRRRGAITDSTRAYAIHLGHDNPHPAELDAALARWGASAPRDGTVIELSGAGVSRPRAARVLVLGATRSGKSAYAEQRLASEPHVGYVATAPDRPGDAEWAERVSAHVRRRPAAWTTVQTGNVTSVLTEATTPVLIDDLGLWLTRVVDEADGWEGPVPDRVATQCDALVAAWRGCRTTAVLVAPEVGSGVVPATASGRRFIDLLGALTVRLAAESDEVVQVVAGLPRRLR
jgi:adenosylcobinamide kinase/adenosylcobinamide-phosphate guanylyltransferase